MEEKKAENIDILGNNNENPSSSNLGPEAQNVENQAKAQGEEKNVSKNENSGSGAEKISESDLKRPKYVLEKQCFVCKNRDNELSLCARCRLVYYCSQECQKKDWRNHKDYCLSIDKQPNKDFISMDHFRDLWKVGTGNFSEIYSAINLFDKKSYAIKIINKEKLKRVRKEADIMMEKHCLKKLMGNPWVIEIYSTFQDELNLYIHFEFMKGGELWEKVKVFGLESVSLVKFFMAQLILALESIHKAGIVHRDLKPENMLLDEKNNIKLVDFGTARDLFIPEIKGSGNSAKGKRVYDHFVGTPQYMAPECIRNKNSDTKSDIWSFACVAFQLVSGFPPFLGGSDYLIFQKSINESPVFPQGIFGEEMKDLIELVLKKEPEERPSLEQIKAHKFFEGLDWGNVRDNYKAFEEKITKEEEFWKRMKEKVLKENLVLLKKEELDSVMANIYDEIQKTECFSSPEDKSNAEIKAKHLEKQFSHFYKLTDFEFETLL